MGLRFIEVLEIESIRGGKEIIIWEEYSNELVENRFYCWRVFVLREEGVFVYNDVMVGFYIINLDGIMIKGNGRDEKGYSLGG